MNQLANRSKIKRLVIIDPSLKTRVGHHYNYVKSIVIAARIKNIETLVFCGIGVQSEIIEELSAKPSFNIDTYASICIDSDYPLQLDSNTRDAQGLVLTSMYFFNELLRVRHLIRPDDLVFFHTVKENQMIAITQWLASFSRQSRPYSNILTRFWNDKSHTLSIYNICSSILMMPSMKVDLTTDTFELAVLYSQLFGRSVKVIPIPHVPSVVPEEKRRVFCRNRICADALIISYIGDCRENKGFMFLREAIEEVLKRLPAVPIHFLVQISHFSFPQHVIDEINKISGLLSKSITLVVETLSTDDYCSIISESDIIIVCYNPHDYRYGSSGIFTEAIAAGKVVVISKGTNMVRESLKWDVGYIEISDYSSSGLSEAITTAVNSYQALFRKSTTAKSKVLNYHNPDNLLKEILGDL